MQGLLLLDETGREEPYLDAPQAVTYPRFSPDGRHLAVQIGLPGSWDIWIYQLPHGPFSRLTSGGGSLYPEWSPDGSRVIFSSVHGEGFDLYWQRADGSAPAEPLLVAPGEQSEAVMAPNGADVVTRTGSGNARDVVAFRVGSSQVRPLAAAPGVPETSPRLSPDGKWLAYYANETGRFEVYVQPFPGPGGRWTISTDGGNFPLWSRDGRTLYYWHGTQFIAARVATSPTFGVVDRRVLFERNPAQGGHTPYEVTPDGKHFLITKPVSTDANLVVVLNWMDEWMTRGRRGLPTP
jgi:serine/threonine-protein kinase